MADKLYTRKQIVRKLEKLRKGYAASYSLRLEPDLEEWLSGKIRAVDEAIAAFPPKKAGSK